MRKGDRGRRIEMTMMMYRYWEVWGYMMVDERLIPEKLDEAWRGGSRRAFEAKA